jgi:hypothetical protein
MFKQLYIVKDLETLPEKYRTAEARDCIGGSYDDCAATLLLPWLFGLEYSGEAVPVR